MAGPFGSVHKCRLRRTRPRAFARVARGAMGPQSGFTLLELMLVIVIIGVLVSMSAPAFRGTMAMAALRSGTNSVVALARQARSMASAHALRYRLNLDPDEGTFWITAELDPLSAYGEFEQLQNTWGRHFALPQHVSFRRILRVENDEEIELSSEEAYITFNTDGTADEAEIEIANDDGDAFVVRVLPLTGRVVIETPEE